MKLHTILDWALSHTTLAVDPITLLAVGLGVVGAATASTVAGQAAQPRETGSAVPTPAQPPAPQAAAPPVLSPQGNSSTFKTGGGQPSFLAAAAAPQQQNISGTKSLLGQ